MSLACRLGLHRWGLWVDYEKSVLQWRRCHRCRIKDHRRP